MTALHKLAKLHGTSVLPGIRTLFHSFFYAIAKALLWHRPRFQLIVWISQEKKCSKSLLCSIRRIANSPWEERQVSKISIALNIQSGNGWSSVMINANWEIKVKNHAKLQICAPILRRAGEYSNLATGAKQFFIAQTLRRNIKFPWKIVPLWCDVLSSGNLIFLVSICIFLLTLSLNKITH